MHVAVGGQRKLAGRGEAAAHDRVAALERQAAHRPIFHFLDPQDQHALVRAGGHCEVSVPECIGAGGAVILYPGHRFAVDAQRICKRGAGLATVRPRAVGADDGGVDSIRLDLGVGKGAGRRLHGQVLVRRIEAVAELGAADPDHRHFALDGHALVFSCHGRAFQ